MKYSLKKHIFTSFLTIVLVICMTIPALSSADIYVNTSEDTLDGAIESSYVVGGGGTEKLGTDEVYAITGSGIVQIGDDEAAAEPGEIEVGEIGATTVNISNDTVKIGLYYYYSSARDSSVESCRVANNVGSGFEFGYYDSDRDFHAVGSTGHKDLTVVKDTNVAVSGGTIGCFHIRLPGSYSSFDEASAAASGYSGGFPAYYSGKFYVLVGNYTSRDDAAKAMSSLGLDGEVFTASNKCVVVTRTGTTDIIFEYDCGDDSYLAVRPVSNSDKAVTYVGEGSSDGYRYYGGFEFIRYNGNNMTVVNYVGMEDYVKGVIPYEMSPSWPKEALKAQAMCARTYAAANFRQYGSYGFDMTNDTYSQVYRGTNLANDTTDAAVDETAGLYVTYDGELCTTFFFSSDGGATASSEDVWAAELPYLRGKIDPYEADVDFNYKSWTYTFTPSELAAEIRSHGYSIGDVVSVEPEYTDVGNMSRITFYDASGTRVSVTKSNTYSVLGLPGIHFTIEFDEDSGEYFVEGGGWGHNVGMSQWGAYSMAKVHGMSYAEIICFYFTGVDISKGVYSA